jgi:hypothetical protein
VLAITAPFDRNLRGRKCAPLDHGLLLVSAAGMRNSHVWPAHCTLLWRQAVNEINRAGPTGRTPADLLIIRFENLFDFEIIVAE